MISAVRPADENDAGRTAIKDSVVLADAIAYLDALTSELEQARCDRERIQRRLDEILESAPHGVALSDSQREIISAGIAAQRATEELETAVCRFRKFVKRESRATKVFTASEAKVRL